MPKNTINNETKLKLMIVAAANGQLGTVNLLIEKGADINAKDKYGQTPLNLTIKNNHTEIIGLLWNKDLEKNPLIKSTAGSVVQLHKNKVNSLVPFTNETKNIANDNNLSSNKALDFLQKYDNNHSF